MELSCDGSSAIAVLSGVDAELVAARQRIAELEGLVEAQARVIDRLQAQVEMVGELEAKVAELERRLGQNSGNSGKPSSRDPAAER